MTDEYVATFFSHYDAVQFAAAARKAGLVAKLMPVPRALSSSCGTGVRMEAAQTALDGLLGDGVDKIFRRSGQVHELVYDSGSGS